MHIHLPKPLHGWREFLGEVGIIVIGVLIALGAEQVVETLHWRKDVREFREAVDKELALNLGTFQFNQMQHDCIRHRIDELQAVLDRSRHGETVTLIGPIAAPGILSQYSSVWDNKDPQVVAHLPMEIRLKYAELYDEFRNTEALKARQKQVWDGLQSFEEPGPLSREDRRQLHALISGARSVDQSMQSNWPLSEQLGAALGIHAYLQTDNALLAGQIPTSGICKPILKR